MVRIAVIGGGVFGTTAAVNLARAGAYVDLFEARHDILDGATSRCQSRLHSGYHYPRSDATAASARDAAPGFAARYPEAIKTANHHYVIAQDSKVSANEYLAFCDRLSLPYEVIDSPHVHHAQLCVRVPESFVDISILRRLLLRDLAQANVAIHFNERINAPLAGYDLTVMATYGQPWSKPLRYELCEVALVEIPRYEGQSFVVLDGSHVSLDPYGRIHALYDVVHSVHDVTEGSNPLIRKEYQDLIDRFGPVQTPLSNVSLMLKTGSQHLRGLEPSGQGLVIYHGSLFSIRAVLPNVDATDERPTLVERHGDVISILSGKICTAVQAAESVVNMAITEAAAI